MTYTGSAQEIFLRLQEIYKKYKLIESQIRIPLKHQSVTVKGAFPAKMELKNTAIHKYVYF